MGRGRRGRWATRQATGILPATRRAINRVRVGLIVLTGLCLALVLACLDRIGPPPRIRIDALWVKGHEATVHVMVLAGLAAAISAGLVIMLRRGQVIVIAMWIAAIIAIGLMFWDRLPIILRVIIRHA